MAYASYTTRGDRTQDRVSNWLNGVVQEVTPKRPSTVTKTWQEAIEVDYQRVDVAALNAICRPWFNKAPETQGHSFYERESLGQIPSTPELHAYWNLLKIADGRMNESVGKESIWLAGNYYNLLQSAYQKLLGYADKRSLHVAQLGNMNETLRSKQENDIKDLRARYHVAKGENTTLRDQFRLSNREKEAFRKKHELAKRDSKALQAKYEDLKSYIRIRTTERENTTRDMTTLRARNELLQQKVDKLEASLQSARKSRGSKTVMARSKTRSRISKP